jgi:hypothetical protein
MSKEAIWRDSMRKPLRTSIEAITAPQNEPIHHQDRAKQIGQGLAELMARATAEEARQVTFQNWKKCMIGDGHEIFYLSQLLQEVSAETLDQVMKNPKTLDKFFKVLQQGKTLDRLVERRIADMPAADLLNILARERRLGYGPGDILCKDETVLPGPSPEAERQWQPANVASQSPQIAQEHPPKGRHTPQPYRTQQVPPQHSSQPPPTQLNPVQQHPQPRPPQHYNHPQNHQNHAHPIHHQSEPAQIQIPHRQSSSTIHPSTEDSPASQHASPALVSSKRRREDLRCEECGRTFTQKHSLTEVSRPAH